MELHVHAHPDAANEAAADLLSTWLTAPGVRTVMVAAGNTPLDLYRRIGGRRRPLGHLEVFVLDEYVGVPPEEPRNCANLLRDAVQRPWGIAPERFHAVSPRPEEAEASIRAHELRIRDAGGLDVVVLGLGQNGHLGFNEPGSTPESPGRVLPLEPISVEANRLWFGGRYAPSAGVTTGMPLLLAARRVMLLAFGAHKTAAVRAMTRGPRSAACPASWLQDHPQTHVFLDTAAAAELAPGGRSSP